ncbi:hypothetical protein Pcinc_028347 [Petrolisthes cinctipes]|uniref:Uncharacterized protein n=1 Tax=Petrolisthes cinctipes TaxID=88211 RepID=A0AAE1F377_PETCI|nr:hypothetical protein Pcinc_028347 [Petrolisthes cinctipes]
MPRMRKMSLSHKVADMGKNIRNATRKMTIHDPSAVSALIHTLQNPTCNNLKVEESQRHVRASSVPPSFLCDDDHHQDNDDHNGYNSATDDLSDEDEYLNAFLMEIGEGEWNGGEI